MTESPSFPRHPWNDQEALELIQAKKDLPGALMPILVGLLDRFGYINTDIVPAIADALNLSKAEVHGVISFYHDFRTTPPGRHTVKICRSESCQAMGGNALIDHVKKRLDVDFHGTTADGRYTLEPVYCLGNCACSPALMVDNHLHGRVTPETFDLLIEREEP